MFCAKKNILAWKLKENNLHVWQRIRINYLKKNYHELNLFMCILKTKVHSVPMNCLFVLSLLK